MSTQNTYGTHREIEPLIATKEFETRLVVDGRPRAMSASPRMNRNVKLWFWLDLLYENLW